MSGTFIVSLDCEGMWGMADQPRSARDFISREKLVKVYRQLLDLFAEFDIPATFAFVGMFVLNDRERAHFESQLGHITYRGRDWLAHYKTERSRECLDGWFCPEAWDMVCADGRHELASHGFTHVPFDGPDTPQEVYQNELRLIDELASSKGVEFKTFVFPRNLIGHIGLLQGSAFDGYREALPLRGGKFGNIVREFNVFQRSQARGGPRDGMVAIPAGYFLNWQHGVRRLVPRAVSALRWNSVLDDAVLNHGVAHVWSHPHNFISAPATLGLLREVLRRAAILRDRGDLVMSTQRKFVEILLPADLSVSV